MIVITLLFGVFYLVDLQGSRFEPHEEKLTNRMEIESNANQPCTSENSMSELERKVPVYVITATFPRLEQLAELTRLGQTLKHAKNLMWIVADDAPTPTKQVMQLLHRLNITHKYILG